MNKKRPILNLPYSQLEKGMEAISFILIVLMWVYLLNAIGNLPGRIPTHFGLTGQADAWGGKGTLMMLPAVGTMLYVLFTVLARYPHIFNYPREVTEANAPYLYRKAREMVGLLKLEEIVLFSYIEWNTIAIANRQSNGQGMLFLPVVLIVIFGSIGYYTYNMLRQAR